MVHLLLRTLLLAGVLLPLLLTDTVALAQVQESRSYRLEELIGVTLQSNPGLQEAASLVMRGRGLQATAAAYPNPSVTGTFGPGRTREALANTQFFERGVIVSQPLE